MAEKSAIGLKALVIGGSAGALEALMQILPQLRSDLNYAIIIVLHRRSFPGSTLADLLDMRCALPVVEIEDKMEMKNGVVYLAPADYHVLFEKNGLFSLDDSEKVNYSRPSIDVSFESAATCFALACAGVLLSGGNTDGTEGLAKFVAAGGLAFVQSPATALVDYMPQSAISNIPSAQVSTPEELVIAFNNFNGLAKPGRKRGL